MTYLSETISLNTNRVNTILNDAYVNIASLPKVKDDDLSNFIFSVASSWSRNISIDKKIYYYLYRNIFGKILSCDSYVINWVTTIYTEDDSLKTLLYRFNILDRVTRLTQFYPTTSSEYYNLVLSSLLTPKVRFSTISHSNIFNIPMTSSPINTLRQSELDINNYLRYLANYSDSSDSALDCQHAMLSSFTLLYLMNLIYIILDHENKVKQEPHLASVIDVIFSTYTKLVDVLVVRIG